MPHRFTITEKWDKPWFTGLSPWSKLVFLYLCDNCDLAGIYEANVQVMPAQTGLTLAQITKALDGLTAEFCGERKVVRRDPYLWVVGFIRHQRNWPLNPGNNAHKSIIRSLDKHSEYFGFDLRKALLDKNLIRGYQGAKEPLPRGLSKGNGKGKGKGIGGAGGKGVTEEFDTEFWPNVPVKTDKKKAREQYVLKRKTFEKETILAGLPSYRAKEERRSKLDGYQAHSPFRWLRDERWDDEAPKGAMPDKCRCGAGPPDGMGKDDYGEYPWCRVCQPTRFKAM